MRTILFVAAVCVALTPLAAATTAQARLTAGLAAYAARDYATARRAFKALADEGSAIGETMLGTIYARGEGVRRDPAAAAAAWFRAAHRGYAPAQLALSRAFAHGTGVAADRRAALFWAKLALERGDARTAAAARLDIVGLNAVAGPDIDTSVADWRPWPSGRD